MSVQFELVRALLVAEIAAFVALLLPIRRKIKSRIYKKICKSSTVHHLWNALRVIYVFICILFLDSLSKSLKLTGQLRNGQQLLNFPNPAIVDSTLHVKMFYAQRNMYLTGFTIFLAIVLHRHIALTMRVCELEEIQEPQTTNNGDEDALESMRAKVEQAEVIMKQFQGYQEEYDRLAERYSQLELQLATGSKDSSDYAKED